MQLIFFIARRYLFSRKNRHAINIISGISVAVVAVATAALVIVLSAMNGFEQLVGDQISGFAPDLKIEARKGKVFDVDSVDFQKIKSIPEIESCEEVLEENVLLRYEKSQKICVLKGVPESYASHREIEKQTSGRFVTRRGNLDYIVPGAGVAYNLGIGLHGDKPVSVWVPNRTAKVQLLNPTASFRKAHLITAGIISLDGELDYKYAFTSLDLLRKLTERNPREVTALEIMAKAGTDIAKLKEKLKESIPNSLIIKDIYDQFAVYKVMKSERLASFIIMLFIILIASFSVIGSVTMLIIEKKEDIFTLTSMGFRLNQIRRIFFADGLLITFVGTLLGVILGGTIAFLQQNYGFVSFPENGNYITEAYPMQVHFLDLLQTFVSVFLIGSLLSLYPATKIDYSYTETR